MFFYLDDGTIGGSVKDVIHNLQLVEDEAGLARLKLNHAKSELICNNICARDAVMSVFSRLQLFIACEQATLLGTPIGSVDLINSILTLKLEKLKLMGERLQHLCCHDALLILRHSLAIPKVLYILRMAPCFLSDQLDAFDEVLQSILSQVLNINLSQEMAWMQASLPIRVGGLGVRRTAQLAPPAYLASAAGCFSLVHQIIPYSSPVHPDPNTEAAIAHWSRGHLEPPPSSPNSMCQRIWDLPHIAATYNALLEQAPNDQAKARLMAVACPESGAWLNALPIASLGLHMSDDVVRIAAGLRLRVLLCRPHHCTCCGADDKIFGTHGLSCRFSKDRHS